MAKSTRVLRIAFSDAEAFQREYVQNLVNGGVFVATIQAFELREPVRVEIVLTFCKKKLRVNGEIVHIVPREMAQVGATPGVAVQFEGSVQEIRTRLDPLVIACGAPLHQPPDSGRRRQPRVAARVAARIEGAGEGVDGHTRNLSRSGALVAVHGEGPAVGERVRLTLEHPTSGEAMQVEARVARQIETAGAVSALGHRVRDAGGAPRRGRALRRERADGRAHPKTRRHHRRDLRRSARRICSRCSGPPRRSAR